MADFFLRDVEFCDASGAFLPRCSVATAPCKSRRLDQRRNSTVLQRECVFTHSLCFLSVSPPPRKLAFGGSLFFQALFACLAFLLRKTHKKTKRRFEGCLADFFLRDVEFCDASGAFLPRCSVATAPCKSRRLDQRRNSTVLQRECVFTHSLCFLSVSPPPRKLAFGVPFFYKPFLLVLRSHLKQAKSALEKAKKSLYPKCTPKKI